MKKVFLYILKIFGLKKLIDKKVYLFPLKKFYSQYGQDYFVFNILNNKQYGFYVDVGARCGKIISNTLFLEQNKWDGICIEPHPDLFDELKKNRKCKIYNCAISNSPKNKLKFVKFLEEPFGNSGLLNTYRKPGRLRYHKHEIIEVNIVSLNTILEKNNAPKFINYIDIDVEGHELECIKTIDFDKYQFGAIGVETIPNSSNYISIVDYLESVGYNPFAVIGSDTFFKSVK